MAFAVAATATNWNRLSKPFNPLLGETYELDRLVDCRRWFYIEVYLTNVKWTA